ncbi:hypothetical protein AOLI_G00059590 [Acnodon oligacanthus]
MVTFIWLVLCKMKTTGVIAVHMTSLCIRVGIVDAATLENNQRLGVFACRHCAEISSELITVLQVKALEMPTMV